MSDQSMTVQAFIAELRKTKGRAYVGVLKLIAAAVLAVNTVPDEKASGKLRLLVALAVAELLMALAINTDAMQADHERFNDLKAHRSDDDNTPPQTTTPH